MRYLPGVVMLMGIVVGGPAGAQEVEAVGMRLRLEAGTITRLVGPDGVVHVGAAAPAALGALRHLRGDVTPVGGNGRDAAANVPLAARYERFIGNEPGQLEMTLTADEQSREVVIEQRGAGPPGLHGIQWGISGVPLDHEIIVPGRSGVKLDRREPGTTFEFAYPIGWEAQFVIVQGKGGGFWVWAEDAEGRYKNLRVWKHRTHWDLAFDTQSNAPFEELTTAESVRWRLGLYEGDWRVPARRYREWAHEAFGLTPLEEQEPAWVRDIRLLVICGMSLEMLEELGRRFDPAQTILYVPSWRRDGYDRNYPDYTALPELGSFMERAHELGFRVMLHVNYFGCDPLHELYEQFEPLQARDPFTKQKLWWTWERADPPIKFAYINPASRAWRELFIERMVELCNSYGVDSLHLDQTLCIWNHAEGLVDGMTMLEGNAALHRELREALPHVALSGEGLNEVTFRHEAFAQRHAWGLSHSEGTWHRPWLERAHPVASFIFRPYTIINGYLGMTSPANEQLYAAWQQAYTNWGLIPTLAWPSLRALQEPEGFSRQLLDEIAFFQEQRVDPDTEGEWPPDTLFPFRTAAGEPVRYERQDGFRLVAGEERRVISATVTGVSELRGPGAIGRWRAYDDTRLFGLNREAWYAYFPHDARDMTAFHIHALPPGLMVEHILTGDDLTAVVTRESDEAWAWIAELLDEARCGYTVFGGEGFEDDGPLTESPAGASFSAASRSLLRLHPPWKAQRLNPQTGVLEAVGTGQVYALLTLELPAVPPGARLEFRSAVRMDPGAVGEGKTDGVTYIVEAGEGAEALSAQVHNALAEPVPLNLDLTPLAGRRVTLRLAADPGPARSATFDWARWDAARIVVDRADRRVMEIVSPRPWAGVVAGRGEATVRQSGPGRYEVEAVLPGAVYLLGREPDALTLPSDLTALPFALSFVAETGVQLVAPQYAGGAPGEGTVGGVTRRGFNAHPPNRGRTLMEFPVLLPPEARRFHASIGLRDGSLSRGCLFIVQVSGEEVARRSILPGGWHDLEADLSPWAGGPVVLSLITDSDGDHGYDWAVWGEPRVE